MSRESRHTADVAAGSDARRIGVDTGGVRDEMPSPDALTCVTEAPVPMVLVELATRRIREVSKGAENLAGASAGELLGTDVTQYLLGGPSPALSLLAAGEIDGYETTRRIRYPDGREAKVHVWSHALDDVRPPVDAVFVIDEINGTALPAWPATSMGASIIGEVDSDWRIERVTNDVRVVLGYRPEEVIGKAFLGAVHPGDIADLLTGLGHAERSGETVVVRVRIRGGDGSWHWCRAWLARTDPGAGFTFMLRPVVLGSDTENVGEELRERLARILYEVNAAARLATEAALPNAGQLPGLADLTSREWEIITALQRGERGNDVARSLHLAPSTVRNHLSSVYHKLGVNSQVELLAALARGNHG